MWSGDWERFDRGCMQEFDRQAVEADGGVLAVGKGEQDCPTLWRTLLQPMEILMEKPQLNFNTPGKSKYLLLS